MRVAILSFYLMESTMPLAKHLSQADVDIDLYCLLPKSDQNTFVFDFLSNKQRCGFVSKDTIRNAWGENLWNYLKSIETNVFVFPTARLNRLFLIDIYYAFIFSKHIRNKNYDIIHIVHSSHPFWNYLFFFIGKSKIVQTLHEVTSHDGKTPKFRIQFLKTLIQNSTPIIFNSKVSKQRFDEFRNSLPNKHFKNRNATTVIRFGLFETYSCFVSTNSTRSTSEALKILNLGRIVPYKGIHLLIEAVKISQKKIPIHLIVAGDGQPYFSFEGIQSYEFINKFCTNEEIIRMITECDFLVLPYISGSQSGVPMTAFLFHKPIIASNIEGFREVIDNMETGIIVDPLNEKNLSSAIELLSANRELRITMSKNIEKKYIQGEFSWSSIAKKTIAFYRDVILSR